MTGIRTILLQAFPDRWRQVLHLFKRVTSSPFGYLMLDVHPASDDCYRPWSHLTSQEGKAQVHTLRADVHAVRKRVATRTRTTYRVIGTHGHPDPLPCGCGGPTAQPPAQDISTMTDMVAELTRPVDRGQLEEEIEDFNLSFAVNVGDALNAFTLPPMAGTGTAQPITTTAPLATSTPITTTTTASSRRPRPVTSTRTRSATTAMTTTAPSRPVTARRSAGAATRTTTPTGRPKVAAQQPRRCPPAAPSPSPPPLHDEEGDDDVDD